MGHQEYVDPLLNEITYVFQVSVTILAFLFNLTLLYIVLRNANSGIGTYRYLITIFAVSDIYYNTVHFIVYPIPEQYGNAFFMRGHGVYKERLGVALYMGAYGHAFPILIFHFLYRLLAISYPRYLTHFSRFLSALMVATMASNALWFSVFWWFFHPDEQSLEVLSPVFNGSIPILIVHTADTAETHSQALYWTDGTLSCPRWRNLIGLGLIALSMTSSYTIITICSYLINKHIKLISISAQSGQLHKQLYRSLMYQSFVPLFTAYYPAGSALLLPAIGFPFYYMSFVGPQSCVTHPLIDPILLIFTITEYRRAFLGMIGISNTTRTIDLQSSKTPTMTEFTQASVVPFSKET